jgi:hypothetical protein
MPCSDRAEELKPVSANQLCVTVSLVANVCLGQKAKCVCAQAMSALPHKAMQRCAAQQNLIANVRFGSKADMTH